MSPTRLSRLESAIRMALEYQKAFNLHDVDRILQLMSDDCVFESASPSPDGAVCSGKKSITQFLQDFFNESPQAHLEIEDIFGYGGNRSVMRWRCEWIDKSGKKKHIRGVDIYQVKNGLISEKLSYVKGNHSYYTVNGNKINIS